MTSTTVTAKVCKGERDITGEYAASAFVWTRNTGNASADAAWNATHKGMKSVALSKSELTASAKVTCTLSGVSPSFGTVTVDGTYKVSHTRAEADENDTLHLENGILSITTEANAYQLEGNSLTANHPQLNGTVTAEAWVYTEVPTKVVEFKYNSEGLRVQKKVTANGKTVVTDYVLHGKLVTEMTCGSDKLHFFYDAKSRPAKVNYNGALYTYVHNLQGDVVGILDSNNEFAEIYRYNSWGECKKEINSNLGYKNPFLYRSYVWDADLGLYMLRSRYYNAGRMRFINSDKFIPYNGISITNNLYCYCTNNPINKCDPSGCWPVPFRLVTMASNWYSIMCSEYIESTKDRFMLRAAAGEIPEWIQAQIDYEKVSGGKKLNLPTVGTKVSGVTSWPTKYGFISYTKRKLVCNEAMGTVSTILSYLGSEKTGDIIDAGIAIFSVPASQLGIGSTIEQLATMASGIIDHYNLGYTHEYYRHAITIRYGYDSVPISVDVTYTFYSGVGYDHNHFSGLSGKMMDYELFFEK